MNGLRALGIAHDRARAGAVRQPFQIRRLHTAHGQDAAAALASRVQRPADTLTPSTSGPSLVPAVAGALLDGTAVEPRLIASTRGPRLAASTHLGVADA